MRRQRPAPAEPVGDEGGRGRRVGRTGALGPPPWRRRQLGRPADPGDRHAVGGRLIGVCQTQCLPGGDRRSGCRHARSRIAAISICWAVDSQARRHAEVAADGESTRRSTNNRLSISHVINHLGCSGRRWPVCLDNGSKPSTIDADRRSFRSFANGFPEHVELEYRTGFRQLRDRRTPSMLAKPAPSILARACGRQVATSTASSCRRSSSDPD